MILRSFHRCRASASCATDGRTMSRKPAEQDACCQITRAVESSFLFLLSQFSTSAVADASDTISGRIYRLEVSCVSPDQAGATKVVAGDT